VGPDTSLGRIIGQVLKLSVQAHPGARVERIELVDDDTLGVWVRARAVDGQANAAIERVVAAALRLRPREVRLVAGRTSRRKILEIDLDGVDAVRERLAHEMRSR
jgi:uncharacterized protein YggU (UPF0235/DUF167 family)